MYISFDWSLLCEPYEHIIYIYILKQQFPTYRFSFFFVFFLPLSLYIHLPTKLSHIRVHTYRLVDIHHNHQAIVLNYTQFIIIYNRYYYIYLNGYTMKKRTRNAQPYNNKTSGKKSPLTYHRDAVIYSGTTFGVSFSQMLWGCILWVSV